MGSDVQGAYGLAVLLQRSVLVQAELQEFSVRSVGAAVGIVGHRVRSLTSWPYLSFL